MSKFFKKLFGALSDKPWQKEQMEADNNHQGKTFNILKSLSETIISPEAAPVPRVSEITTKCVIRTKFFLLFQFDIYFFPSLVCSYTCISLFSF